MTKNLFAAGMIGLLTLSGCMGGDDGSAVDDGFGADGKADGANTHAAPNGDLVIDESGNGETFAVYAGNKVIVRLATNPTTGYEWSVTSTDRTFGYPEQDFEGGDGAIGSGGTAVMTWQTDGPLSQIGTHRVDLAYKRPGARRASRRFRFRVEVVEAPATSDAVVIDESGDGASFDVTQGQDVVVRLASNPTTGYDWIVASTDRSFGYPESMDFEASSGAIGSGGTAVLTWKTSTPFALGSHTVTLEYRRPWDEGVDAERTFTFTVDVHAAAPSNEPLVIDESGDGRTFTVAAGRPIVVKLGSNPTTGYDWAVVRTDRSFGYPESTTFEASSGAVGAGGTSVLTWRTDSPFARGTHSVTLGYRRSWETGTDPARTFSFTVDVQP